jgi:hypothetical protein
MDHSIEVWLVPLLKQYVFWHSHQVLHLEAALISFNNTYSSISHDALMYALKFRTDAAIAIGPHGRDIPLLYVRSPLAARL